MGIVGDSMIDRKLQNYFSKQEKIMISNIITRYQIYKKTGKSTCSDFLNPRELMLVTSYLNREKVSYSIYNDYPFLEKRIVYFGEYQDFITFYRIALSSHVTHSHILGTLFSLGLDEHTIGDILLEDGFFYYTNLTRLNPFLEGNLYLIHHELVTLERVSEIELKKKRFETFTILTSSMRIDTIISRIASKSRSQVQEMFQNNFVFLNYTQETSSSTLLKEGDILSIRKVGKFMIGKEKGFTKKNHIKLEISKYI